MLSEGNDLYYFSRDKEKGTILVKLSEASKEKKEIIKHYSPLDFDVNTQGVMACIYASGDGLENYKQRIYTGNWNESLKKSDIDLNALKVKWQEEELLIVYGENCGTGLGLYNVETKKFTKYITGSPDFYINSIFPYSKGTFLSITFRGNADIYFYDYQNGEFSSITSTEWNETDLFLSDSYLYFISDETGIFNIARLELESGLISIITEDCIGFSSPVEINGKIYARSYRNGGSNLFQIDDTVEISQRTLPEKTILKSFSYPEDQILPRLNPVPYFPVPYPRLWVPLLIPTGYGISGFGAAAGWDDFKNLLWYGIYTSITENYFFDLHLIKRGDIPFEWSLFKYDEHINTFFNIQFPFYGRPSQIPYKIVPSLSLSIKNLENITDWSFFKLSVQISQTFGAVDLPENPVKVPEFFSVMGFDENWFFSAGKGFILPMSSTGLFSVSLKGYDYKIGIDSWTPINLKPVGTVDGRFRFNSMAIHSGFFLSQGTIPLNLEAGIVLSLGIQYWLDFNLTFDVVYDFEKIVPNFSFNISGVL